MSSADARRAREGSPDLATVDAACPLCGQRPAEPHASGPDYDYATSGQRIWTFRRCARCGHVGCCDSSPSQHASKHAAATGHPLVRSFEPEEEWFYNFVTDEGYDSGPQLAPPDHHPLDQPVPGPAGRVPPDWQSHLH